MSLRAGCRRGWSCRRVLLAAAALAVFLVAAAPTVAASAPNYSEMPDYDLEILVDFEDNSPGAENCFDLVQSASGAGGGSGGRFNPGTTDPYRCRIRQDGDARTFAEWEISFWVRADVAKTGSSLADAVMRTELSFLEASHSMAHTMNLAAAEWVEHLDTSSGSGSPLGVGAWQWLSFTVASPHLFHRRRLPARVNGRPLDPALPANFVNHTASMVSSAGEGEVFWPGLGGVAFVPLGTVASFDDVRIRAKRRYFRAETIVGRISADPPAAGATGPTGLDCSSSQQPQLVSAIAGQNGDIALAVDVTSHANAVIAECSVTTQPPGRLLSSWVLDLEVEWVDTPGARPHDPALPTHLAAIKAILAFGAGSHGFPEHRVAVDMIWNAELGQLAGIGPAAGDWAPFSAGSPSVSAGNRTKISVDFAPSEWGLAQLDNVGLFASTMNDGTDLFDRFADVPTVVLSALAGGAGAAAPKLFPSVVRVDFVVASSFHVVLDNVRLTQRGVVVYEPVTSSSSAAPTTSAPSPWTVGLQLKDAAAAVELGEGPTAVHLYNSNGVLATDVDLNVAGHAVSTLVARLDAVDALLQTVLQRLDALESV